MVRKHVTFAHQCVGPVLFSFTTKIGFSLSCMLRHKGCDCTEWKKGVNRSKETRFLLINLSTARCTVCFSMNATPFLPWPTCASRRELVILLSLDKNRNKTLAGKQMHSYPLQALGFSKEWQDAFSWVSVPFLKTKSRYNVASAFTKLAYLSRKWQSHQKTRSRQHKSQRGRWRPPGQWVKLAAGWHGDICSQQLKQLRLGIHTGLAHLPCAGRRGTRLQWQNSSGPQHSLFSHRFCGSNSFKRTTSTEKFVDCKIQVAFVLFQTFDTEGKLHVYRIPRQGRRVFSVAASAYAAFQQTKRCLCAPRASQR